MNKLHAAGILLVISAMIFGLVCVVASCVFQAMNGKSPTPSSPFGSSHSQFVRDSEGGVVSGFSTGDGFTISWRSDADPFGAQPVDVVAVALERLRHLQKTNTGGNGYAKAIWNLEKTVESLQIPELPESSGGFIKPPEKENQ